MTSPSEPRCTCGVGVPRLEHHPDCPAYEGRAEQLSSNASDPGICQCGHAKLQHSASEAHCIYCDCSGFVAREAQLSSNNPVDDATKFLTHLEATEQLQAAEVVNNILLFAQKNYESYMALVKLATETERDLAAWADELHHQLEKLWYTPAGTSYSDSEARAVIEVLGPTGDAVPDWFGPRKRASLWREHRESSTAKKANDETEGRASAETTHDSMASKPQRIARELYDACNAFKDDSSQWQRVSVAIHAAHTEIDRLRADAERYRWLRRNEVAMKQIAETAIAYLLINEDDDRDAVVGSVIDHAVDAGRGA